MFHWPVLRIFCTVLLACFMNVLQCSIGMFWEYSAVFYWPILGMFFSVPLASFRNLCSVLFCLFQECSTVVVLLTPMLRQIAV